MTTQHALAVHIFSPFLYSTQQLCSSLSLLWCSLLVSAVKFNTLSSADLRQAPTHWVTAPSAGLTS